MADDLQTLKRQIQELRTWAYGNGGVGIDERMRVTEAQLQELKDQGAGVRQDLDSLKRSWSSAFDMFRGARVAVAVILFIASLIGGAGWLAIWGRLGELYKLVP